MDTTNPSRFDAIVLKINDRSARVRVAGEAGQVTFRSTDVRRIAPGQIVTLAIDRRWVWKGHEYASGRIENPRIDIEALGLEPLPLTGGDLMDHRCECDPFAADDPYAPLWRAFTAEPRRSFEMDPIAWGQFPDTAPADNPTCEAAELAALGQVQIARELLMDTLAKDLRCVDAHGHLGSLEFDHAPRRALIHYDIGRRIAELSLPAGFDGVLRWGRICNRPYLRCLHGLGLCLWRLGDRAQAQQVFERVLSLNPNDHQGMRFCWDELRRGLEWQPS